MPRNRQRSRRRQIRKQLQKIRPPGADQSQLAPDVAQQAGRSPTPWNAQSQSQIAGLQQGFRDTTADLAYQRGGVEQEFGFNDMSDPYNRARLLQQSHNENQNRTINSAAGAGQLYSGSTQRARESNLRDFGQRQHALRGEYEGRIYGLDREGIQAQRELQQGTLEARAGALEAGLESEPDPSEAPPGAPGKLSGQQEKRRQQLQKQLKKLGRGKPSKKKKGKRR